MKAIRLLRTPAGQPVLVMELPRRDGRGEAVVVGGRPEVLRYEFDEPAECSWFVQGFDSLSAADAVADRIPPRVWNVA
ncbi:hypothetical protein QEL94_004340 [Pseudomonas putida]|nr:hypothetical protein [Pseudomonas putida]